MFARKKMADDIAPDGCHCWQNLRALKKSVIARSVSDAAISTFPLGGIKSERVLWTMKRGFYAAAVEKIEDQRKPEDFFGHRKGVAIRFAVVL